MGRGNSQIDRSQRQLRVAEQIKHVLTDVLQRETFKDEILRDAKFLSIPEVRISPDLKNASAFVSSLNQDQLSDIITALNNINGLFQKHIASQLNLKFTPKIRFIEDETGEEVNRIEALLQKIHDEKT